MPPKPGTTHAGSRTAILAALEVGQYAYIETNATDFANVMRAASGNHARRPALVGRTFQSRVYRAIGSAVDDIRILVRVERLT